MTEKIYISFPMEMEHDPKEQFTNRVNRILDPINAEINSWNGFVDFIETDSGRHEFVAKCDNDDIREKMQLLLDASGINHRQSGIGNRQSVNGNR